MEPDKNTGKKWGGILPGLLLLTLFSVATMVLAWKIVGYLRDEQTSLDYWGTLQNSMIIADAPSPAEEMEHKPVMDEPGPAWKDAQTEEPVIEPKIPAAIDFDRLREINADAVAWIFAPDTKLNYVVAQSGDNTYYLRRLLDGTYASGGTLFADYRCSADLSDWNTVIYGHYMKNGTMFGELANYRDPAYYTEHPVMYLYTPGKRYTLELIAGYITDINDIVYSLPASRETRDELLVRAVEKSSFQSGVAVGDEDRLVTLSTCAYDYDNARYVVIARIVEETTEKNFFAEHGFAEN